MSGLAVDMEKASEGFDSFAQVEQTQTLAAALCGLQIRRVKADPLIADHQSHVTIGSVAHAQHGVLDSGVSTNVDKKFVGDSKKCDAVIALGDIEVGVHLDLHFKTSGQVLLGQRAQGWAQA